MSEHFTVVLFTNRSMIVFGEDGHQRDLQNAVSCYEIDREKLAELLTHPCTFYIARWGEWRRELTRHEFEYLLGCRTREMDLAEQEIRKP